MLGTVENPGVMFLTMMDLYKKISEVREEKTCEVAVSYCEVSVLCECVEGEKGILQYLVLYISVCMCVCVKMCGV